MSEYHTIGEVLDAVAGEEHDAAVEATLQWMVNLMCREADSREEQGLTGLCFSAASVRGLAEQSAHLLRKYRADKARRSGVE